MMGTFKLKLKKEEGIFIRVILYIRSEICVLNLSSLHLFVCFFCFLISKTRGVIQHCLILHLCPYLNDSVS